jgi:hypothetical protein
MLQHYASRCCAAVLAYSFSLLIAGCAGATPRASGGLPAIMDLPAVSGLDALHGASFVAGWPVRVREPITALNTKDIGAGLFLMAPGDGIAYAIYKIDKPTGAVLSVRASGSGALWLVAADYAHSRWELAAPIVDGVVQVDLTALGDAVSPGGFIYCAVVCAQNTSGLLDVLTLNYTPAGGGNRYYVAPGGVDGGAGTDAAPWATLQFAADNVAAGDSVIVRAGNYAGFHLQTSGTPDAPICFLAEFGVQITADNPSTPDGINIEDWSGTGIHDVEIVGFTVNNRTRTGIRVVGTDTSFAHHITIRANSCDANGRWGILTGFVDDMLIKDNTCTGSVAEHGIYFGNSGDYVTIRNNTCAHNHGCGIHMNGDASLGDDGIISGALVEDNTVFDNGTGGGSGINCDGVQHSTIRNNLLYGNHASGISLYQIDGGAGAIDNAVLHNTVLMAADGRWCLNLQDNSTGALVFNNVFFNDHAWRGSITLGAYPLAGFTSDYNAVMDRLTPDDSQVLTLAQWQMATGQDMHSFVATPAQMFTNPAGNDYTPALLGPLRDSAYAPYAPALDIAGTQRPQHNGCDVGAYEGM